MKEIQLRAMRVLILLSGLCALAGLVLEIVLIVVVMYKETEIKAGTWPVGLCIVNVAFMIVGVIGLYTVMTTREKKE